MKKLFPDRSALHLPRRRTKAAAASIFFKAPVIWWKTAAGARSSLQLLPITAKCRRSGRRRRFDSTPRPWSETSRGPCRGCSAIGSSVGCTGGRLGSFSATRTSGMSCAAAVPAVRRHAECPCHLHPLERRLVAHGQVPHTNDPQAEKSSGVRFGSFSATPILT